MSVFDDLLESVSANLKADFFSISANDLHDSSIIGRLRVFVKGGLTPSEAQDILDRIVPVLGDSSFAQNSPQIYQALQPVADYLRFIALPFRHIDELERLFGSRIIFALNEGLDLTRALQLSFLALADDYTGRKTRKLLTDALYNNAEHLPIRVEQTASSTLRNQPDQITKWLKSYDSTTGSDKERFAFERVNYVTKNEYARTLGEYDRVLLTKILEIYDFLRFVDVPFASDLITVKQHSIKQDKKELAGAQFEVEQGVQNVILSASKEAADVISKNEFPEGKNLDNISQSSLGTQTASPDAFKQSSAVLVFDREDELEVDKHRIKAGAGGELLEQQLRQYANEFIGEQKLTFKDESNRRRFVGVFVSRLKGVRSIVDVRELLQKPAEAGGLGLVGEALERVVNMVEGAVKTWSTKPKGKFDGLIRHEVVSGPVVKNPVMTTPTELPGRAAYTPPPVPTPPPPPPVESTVVSTSIQGKAESLTPSGEEEVIAPVSTMPRVAQGAPSFDRAKAEEWRQRMLQELAVKAAAGNVQGSMPNAQTGERGRGKPTLTDVKAPPKVLGPLEELKSMTIIDLRRLAPTSTEQLAKVQQKIDVIGETSLTRRLEAIKAWQASEVYQLYLKLGRQSMGQGKTIGSLVQQAISLGEPTLTDEEFNSIVDFNTKLRF